LEQKKAALLYYKKSALPKRGIKGKKGSHRKKTGISAPRGKKRVSYGLKGTCFHKKGRQAPDVRKNKQEKGGTPCTQKKRVRFGKDREKKKKKGKRLFDERTSAVGGQTSPCAKKGKCVGPMENAFIVRRKGNRRKKEAPESGDKKSRSSEQSKQKNRSEKGRGRGLPLRSRKKPLFLGKTALAPPTRKVAEGGENEVIEHQKKLPPAFPGALRWEKELEMWKREKTISYRKVGMRPGGEGKTVKGKKERGKMSSCGRMVIFEKGGPGGGEKNQIGKRKKEPPKGLKKGFYN